MSQRTLLSALAVAILLVLAGVALVTTDTLQLFGTGAQDAREAAARCGPTVDPFADDPAVNIKFDGRDEHGPYINGPDGRRIYVDEKGRRYILGPDGKRVYVDEFGRPIDGRSAPAGRPGTAEGGSGSTPAGKPGESTTDNPDEAANEEEANQATLTGQVVDDAGKPYAGATVTAQVAGGESVKAISGEEGGFKLTLPAEKSLTLTAADAYGNTSKAVTTKLAPGATALKQPLVLPRDTAISGVVRDLDTGLPIEGAQVLLMEGVTHSFSVKHTQAADSGGAFAFAKLTPAAYRLQITRDGYAPRILNSVEPPANLIVEMSAGAVITGTVKDTGGNPIAGAVVSCDFYAEPAQKFHTEATSDEAGYYVVKCQPESQHNTLSVIAAGFKADKRTFVKSGSSGVDFALDASGNSVLRGRLLKQDNMAVTSATFRVSLNFGGETKLFQSVGPDADGVFWCEVAENAENLHIKSPGLAELRVEITPVPGGEVDLGDIYLDTGYAVFGVIKKKGTASPIADADVSIDPAHVKSDKNGKYRIEGLSADPFILRVGHPAYLGTAKTVTPGAEHEIELNIELETADFVARVRVIDQATQQPIAGAQVTAIAYSMTVPTDAEGIAYLMGLSAMSIDVRVEAPGYAAANAKVTADISEKIAALPPHDVALVPGGNISGLCSSNGQPLPAATKVEIWNTTKLVATELTDTEGAYSTENLPLGTYYIGLPDYHVAPQKFELTHEVDYPTHDFEIGAVCHLRGKLLRSDGQPHANAGVYVYRRDNVYWCATIHTGPDGKYEVMNLFPGEWVFCALKTQGDTAAQFAVKVSVSAAGWTTKDVQLPQITGVVTGRVTYPNGEPVKKARVSVTNLSADFPRALLAAYVVTNDDGYYTAERLENGAQMQVRVGGYQDEAATGTAFSEVVTIPSDNAPVEANIVVAPSGVTVRVAMRRADGGPIMNGGPLCYLFDAEGRLSGLYFGGGVYVGSIDLYDVVPGTYTLVVTNRGMVKGELQITVGTEPIMTGLEILLEPEERE